VSAYYRRGMDNRGRLHRLRNDQTGETLEATPPNQFAAVRWALESSEREGWDKWTLEVEHEGTWLYVADPSVHDPGPTSMP
jgi:hypothetical protein